LGSEIDHSPPPNAEVKNEWSRTFTPSPTPPSLPYRHCAYYVTRRRVRVTVVGIEKQYVLNILSACLYCSRSFPTCKTHAPYIVICGLSLSFYLINGTFGGGGILNIKCVFFIFATSFVCNISNVKNLAIYY